MKYQELALRFFGFLTPWIAFSLLQYYVLHIHASYTMMLYGGIAALVSITVRDELISLVAKKGNAPVNVNKTPNSASG